MTMAEATQDAAKPARKKNAHYDVYRRLDVVHIDGLDEAWEPVSVDLAAPSRREAVAKATAQMSEEDQYGTFLRMRADGSLSADWTKVKGTLDDRAMDSPR